MHNNSKTGFNERFSMKCRKKSGVALVLLDSTLWLVQKNSRHSPNHSDAKLKQNTNWSPVFSRAPASLLRFPWVFFFHLIGRCAWFWFYDNRSKSPLFLNYLQFSPSVNVHRVFEFFFQSLTSGSLSEKLALSMIHLTPKRNEKHTNIKFYPEVSVNTSQFSLNSVFFYFYYFLIKGKRVSPQIFYVCYTLCEDVFLAAKFLNFKF